MSSKDKWVEWTRTMLRIRRFEEKCAQIYQQGKFGGFCHLYNGQEALVVGAEAALNKDDYFMTAYRDHAHGIVRGVTLEQGFAELLGKATGCSQGKGGSMHFFNVEQKFMGGWGIVGGHIPLAAGLAMAAKYQKTDQVSMVFLGDGAMPQGVVFETFNMASLWDLPLLVIIENNQYAMGTPLERSNANHENLFQRAEPFGIKCSRVDGYETDLVHKFFDETVAEIRKTQRPQLVEVMTYRHRGHSMSDPIHGVYRSKGEVEEIKTQQDPISLLRAKIIEAKLMSDEDLKAMDKEVKAEVAEALKAAEAAPVPDPEALYRDVYA